MPKKHVRGLLRKPWGCPLTKNRAMWCYALCVPKNGLGACGRPAGHAYLSRTQRAILNHKLRKAAEREADAA